MDNQEKLLIILKTTLSFTIEKFLSHNLEGNIKNNLKIDRSTGRCIFVSEIKMLSIVKDPNIDPVIMIHESLVISEAISFWYHGFDCIESLKEFVFYVNFNNIDYPIKVFYDKDTKWFRLSSIILNKIWNNIIK